MKCGQWCNALLFAAVLSTGCDQAQNLLSQGNHDSGTFNETNGQGRSALDAFEADSETNQELRPDAQPGDVVAAFLHALKSGDDQKAAYLLTDRARRETEKENLVVQPPGTPSAKFVVGDVEYVSEKKDGAQVKSIWTETDQAGGTDTYEIIWILRRQDNGWRISGMATGAPPDESLVLLDFENAKEMIEKMAEGLADHDQADPGVREAQREESGNLGNSNLN